jgi:hypothetical protein
MGEKLDATEYIKLTREHGTKIIDLAEPHNYLGTGIKPEIVHWMRSHSVKDLEDLCLEMHSNGDDISDLISLVSELEDIEEKLDRWEYEHVRIEKELKEAAA